MTISSTERGLGPAATPTLRARADRSPPLAALVIALALCAVTAAITLPHAWQVGLLAGVACGALLSANADWAVLLRRLGALAPLALGAAAARAFALHSGAHAAADAFAAGALLAARVGTAALWTSWLGATLSAHAIDCGLRRLGVPAALVRLLALTRRFAGQLTGTATSAWSAAAMRGGFGSPRASAHTLGLLSGVVLVRALVRAERVADALALRGDALDANPDDL